MANAVDLGPKYLHLVVITVLARISKGKVSCCFRWSTPKCFASVSLKIEDGEVSTTIFNINENHIDTCELKTDEFFETRNFLKRVRREIFENPTTSVNQVYENQRAIHKAGPSTSMPDYADVKSGLKKTRRPTNRNQAFANFEQLIITDKFTSNWRDRFLIYDNKKNNRILSMNTHKA